MSVTSFWWMMCRSADQKLTSTLDLLAFDRFDGRQSGLDSIGSSLTE
jgi:hypothetical protein